jgi:hypothetical protein
MATPIVIDLTGDDDDFMEQDGNLELDTDDELPPVLFLPTSAPAPASTFALATALTTAVAHPAPLAGDTKPFAGINLGAIKPARERELVCPVCMEGREGRKEIDLLLIGLCEHTICGGCLLMLRAPTCPTCRGPVTEHDLRRL